MNKQTQNSNSIKKDIILRQLGRPQKITKNNIKQIIKFFDEYQSFDELPIEKQAKNGETTTQMTRIPSGLPTLAKLADYLGINRTRIYHWYADNPDFKRIYDKLKNKFEEELIANNAILGKFNSNFSKFYLINKHGYRDKSEEDASKAETPKQFNTQINYFLGQQGVKPLELTEKVQKGNLEAFRSE